MDFQTRPGLLSGASRCVRRDADLEVRNRKYGIGSADSEVRIRKCGLDDADIVCT